MSQTSRNLAPSERRRASRPAGKHRQAQKPVVPLNNTNFRVLIGKQELGFCQISRLESGMASFSGQEREAPVVSLVPGQTAPARLVVLKRALTQSKALFQWWSNTNRGRRDLRDVTIHQLDSDGETLVNTWLLYRCSPRRWTGPEFIALGEGIAFEEIEFTYQKLEWL